MRSRISPIRTIAHSTTLPTSPVHINCRNATQRFNDQQQTDRPVTPGRVQYSFLDNFMGSEALPGLSELSLEQAHDEEDDEVERINNFISLPRGIGFRSTSSSIQAQLNGQDYQDDFPNAAPVIFVHDEKDNISQLTPHASPQLSPAAGAMMSHVSIQNNGVKHESSPALNALLDRGPMEYTPTLAGTNPEQKSNSIRPTVTKTESNPKQIQQDILVIIKQIAPLWSANQLSKSYAPDANRITEVVQRDSDLTQVSHVCLQIVKQHQSQPKKAGGLVGFFKQCFGQTDNQTDKAFIKTCGTIAKIGNSMDNHILYNAKTELNNQLGQLIANPSPKGSTITRLGHPPKR